MHKFVLKYNFVQRKGVEMFDTKHYVNVGTILRMMGWSHKSIAQYLGTSESWCRHNLAGVHADHEFMTEVADEVLRQHGLN